MFQQESGQRERVGIEQRAGSTSVQVDVTTVFADGSDGNARELRIDETNGGKRL
jgi:hypothetical protein